jgi:hypothetical protein
LQVLHLDVSKVNRMLHMGCAWEVAGGAGPLLGRSVASPMLLGRSLARSKGSFSCVWAPSDASASSDVRTLAWLLHHYIPLRYF